MSGAARRARATTIAVLASALAALAAAPANADHWWWAQPYTGAIIHLQGGHHPGFGFYNGADQDAEVRTRLEYARGAWNYAPYMTIGNVGSPGSAHVRAWDDYYGYTTWSGLTWASTWDGNHTAYFDVYMNLSYMSSPYPTAWQYKQAVACHELGHALAGVTDQTVNDPSCMAVGYGASPYNAYMTDQRYRLPSAHDRGHQLSLWDSFH